MSVNSRPRRPIVRKWGSRSVFAVNNKWVYSWLQRCMWTQRAAMSALVKTLSRVQSSLFASRRSLLHARFFPFPLSLPADWNYCTHFEQIALESRGHGLVASFCLVVMKAKLRRGILDAITFYFFLQTLRARIIMQKPIKNKWRNIAVSWRANRQCLKNLQGDADMQRY